VAGVAALLTFLAVLAVLAAAWRSATATQQALRERMGQYLEASPAGGGAAAETRGPELTGWRAFVRNMSHHFVWSGRSQALERKLVQAGLPLKGAEFAVICAGTMVAGGAAMFAAGGGRPMLVLVGVAVGYLVPMLTLRVKAARRVRKFNDQLADALVLVGNSLRTGYSFLQAIEMVSREMAPPIGAEFARVLKEMNLGVTTEEALVNLGERVVSDDLDLVITAVLIQRQVGGNLAEVLDSIAGTIRERIRLKGEVRTLTAQGRASGIIIGVLPFALAGFIYVINPKYMMTLFTHPLGLAMVAYALVSMAVGMAMVWKIVNIEY
jgi:tight adherence protein B